MTKYLTGRISNLVKLLVGVCLIGTAFHIHQLYPDYTLQDSDIPHHFSVDQPDCVACMNLMQSTPAIDGSDNIIRHESRLISLFADQVSLLDFISDLNNKSPPVNCSTA